MSRFASHGRDAEIADKAIEARLDEIVERLLEDKASLLDVGYLQRCADQLPDSAVDAYRGFEDEGTVLRSKVVRGRQDYVCHWTGMPIAKGERHLALTETWDGEIATTRHSMLAIYCDVVLGDDSLADCIKMTCERVRKRLDAARVVAEMSKNGHVCADPEPADFEEYRVADNALRALEGAFR